MQKRIPTLSSKTFLDIFKWSHGKNVINKIKKFIAVGIAAFAWAVALVILFFSRISKGTA